MAGGCQPWNIVRADSWSAMGKVTEHPDWVAQGPLFWTCSTPWFSFWSGWNTSHRVQDHWPQSPLYIKDLCPDHPRKRAKGIHVLLKSKLPEWSGDPEHVRNRWIDCVSQQVHHYASEDPKVTWAMVSHFELYLFESLKPQGEPIKVHLELDHNKWLWF